MEIDSVLIPVGPSLFEDSKLKVQIEFVLADGKVTGLVVRYGQLEFRVARVQKPKQE